MDENLQKREINRVLTLNLKRKEKECNKIESEDTDSIMKQIYKLKNDIELKIKELNTNDAKLTLQANIDEITKDYSSLNKFINDSSMYLPTYNVKVVQDILSSLRADIDAKKNLFIPKAKFSFKKSFVAAPKREDKKQSSDVTDFSVNRENFDVESLPCYGFKNINNDKTLILSAKDANEKDLVLENLENCVIKIYGTPNTIRVNNLSNSELYCGPIITSAFVNKCQNCKFHIACQQLRIHSTLDCDIYLYVFSRAIIEDSTKLRFSPYNWVYDDILEHFIFCQLDPKQNNWKQIDDFNWLSPDEPSPNWTIVA